MSWISDSSDTAPAADDAGWQPVTDHNRQPLSISVERLEKKNVMANGITRRYTVNKKRSFSANWNLVPSKSEYTADGGLAGDDIETWHNTEDGPFWIMLKDGDGNVEKIRVMISDFSKEIDKRSPNFDLLTIDLTLEEVGGIK